MDISVRESVTVKKKIYLTLFNPAFPKLFWSWNPSFSNLVQNYRSQAHSLGSSVPTISQAATEQALCPGGMQREAGPPFALGDHTGWEVRLSDHEHSFILPGITELCSLRTPKWVASFPEDGVESIQATKKLNQLPKVLRQLGGTAQS